LLDRESGGTNYGYGSGGNAYGSNLGNGYGGGGYNGHGGQSTGGYSAGGNFGGVQGNHGGFQNSNLGSGLARIDFDKTDLVPFEKDFYIEHPDVTKRSEVEADSWRASKQIVVSGHGNAVPKPVLTFEEASMPEYVLNEVLKCGFSTPTPIQVRRHVFVHFLFTISTNSSLNSHTESGMAYGFER
jgi:ATP-dependent RNA helicase DDX5/DBP2